MNIFSIFLHFKLKWHKEIVVVVSVFLAECVLKIFDNSNLQFVCCVQSLERKVDAIYNYPWYSGGLTVWGLRDSKFTQVCSRMQCSCSGVSYFANEVFYSFSEK
jgi:hypothetical protein